MKLLHSVKLVTFMFSTILVNTQSFADSTTTGVPDKAIDLSALAIQLGESLSQKAGPDISEADVIAAMEAKSDTAKKLAAVFPEGETRSNMEKLYNLSLFSHKQSEIYLGLPKNDLYGALAAFLYGNWSSYNDGKTVPDKYLPTVAKDIKDLFEATPVAKQIEESNEDEKKLAYEEFAIIGNWMLIMQQQLKKEPNPEASKRLKELSVQYFSRLQIKPEQFNISDKGHIELSK